MRISHGVLIKKIDQENLLTGPQFLLQARATWIFPPTQTELWHSSRYCVIPSMHGVVGMIMVDVITGADEVAVKSNDEKEWLSVNGIILHQVNLMNQKKIW